MVYLPGGCPKPTNRIFTAVTGSPSSQTAVGHARRGRNRAACQAAVSRLSGKTALLLLHLYDPAAGSLWTPRRPPSASRRPCRRPKTAMSSTIPRAATI
jgi:hypothetical protein